MPQNKHIKYTNLCSALCFSPPPSQRVSFFLPTTTPARNLLQFVFEYCHIYSTQGFAQNVLPQHSCTHCLVTVKLKNENVLLTLYCIPYTAPTVAPLNSSDANGTCANCWANFALTENPQKPQQPYEHRSGSREAAESERGRGEGEWHVIKMYKIKIKYRV